YLEFDDIRQVNATCLTFREVVKEFDYIRQLSYFARLPRSFREQYRQNALQKKKSLDFHPFANPAPPNDKLISFRNRIVKNLPQMSALLSLATLRNMEKCWSYHPVERYKVTLPVSEARDSYFQTGATLDVCFSPSSGHLLFYGNCLNDSQVLARNDQGQWSKEPLNGSNNSGNRVITAANFSAGKNRLLTCNSEGCVNTLRHAHHCWDVVGKVTLPDPTAQFSPSGKYMVSYSDFDPVIVWRMDENEDWLEMEVMELSPKIVLIDKVLFSPSERHLVLLQRLMGQVTVLSLDDHGAWLAQHLVRCRSERITHASFSQVTDQLLVCIRTNSFGFSGRVSIHSPEPSGRWQETLIFPEFYLIDFSPADKYLFTTCAPHDQRHSHDVLLWHRPEKWSDWSLNNCFLPGELYDASTARLNSEIRLTHDFPVNMALFSPSDSHFLTGTYFGKVCIWGKSQAGEWSIQIITRDCAPATTPCFSLSGLHVLTYNPSFSGILGCSDQKHWSLKGAIEQHDIVHACFNPISEHEVVVLGRNTEDDTSHITLTVWEIRDAGG
ncbi:WD40 repeat domain-containing protein, partial [Endozoicomonas sp. ONNA2]|uniref:WD40 repeat domain-containing protein n=1 Tax=Endozoicomonas sp. ONNA2 TaxID=2828741 RepID=UPI0021491C42